MRVENYSSYQPYTNKQKNKSLQNKNLINNFDNINTTQNNVNFKAKFWDKIGKFYGEKYANKIMDKHWIQNLAKHLSGVSEQMTQHMATVGSLLTSGVYFYQTITNKKLENDKRTTLGINQIGCFIIPTLCAYGVDYKLRNFNKNMEYLYSGLKRQQMALGKISPEKCDKLIKTLGTKLKSFGALMGLFTFTFIYRFATPVAITPVANWGGEKYLKWKKSKQQGQNIQQNLNLSKKIDGNKNTEIQSESSKEIVMKPAYENKQVANEIELNQKQVTKLSA